MNYFSEYKSPIGNMLLTADEVGINGLWFFGQKYFPQKIDAACGDDFYVIKKAKDWLECYFCGEEPNFNVDLHFIGTTFQIAVWNLLLKIPYGSTTTYGALAKNLAEIFSVKKMSAQAVGGAVGHNRISILVPCHRVIGADGNLAGYAGGIDKKIELLKLEGVTDFKNIGC